MCSTRAKQLPEITKLPDNIVSPFFFVIGSDSPVINDSFTSTTPSNIIESTTI